MYLLILIMSPGQSEKPNEEIIIRMPGQPFWPVAESEPVRS
jgi:hypothetical protein